MSEWLFPVNPAIYDIDRAYHDAHQYVGQNTILIPKLMTFYFCM